MADIDANVIIDISTKIAAIDERTKALQNADVQAQVAADHRYKNTLAAMENFVPRREIMAMDEATRTYAANLSKATEAHCDANREIIVARVTKIEGDVAEIKGVAKSFRNWMLGVLGSAAVAFLYYLAGYVPHLIKLLSH